MSGVVPLCTVQVQSHLKDMVVKASQRELLDRVQLLAMIFLKKGQEIGTLLSHPKFTFLNAFELIDRR